jgi:hypothetical protein
METRYEQFWTATTEEMWKRNGRNLDWKITGIWFEKFQASASV